MLEAGSWSWSDMLDIRKRTGYLFLAVMVAQVILVSAQVQTKTGVRVAAGGDASRLFSRVQFGTASVVNGVQQRLGELRRAARRAGGERRAEAASRRSWRSQLQQEHALAARSAAAAGADGPEVAGDACRRWRRR